MNTFIVPIMKADVLNKNNRVYPKHLLPKIVENYNSKPIKIGGSFSEKFNIDVDKISHAIKRVWVDEDVMYAEIEVLNTDAGKELLNLIETMGFDNIVFRTSGMGNIVDGVVQDDYELCYINMTYAGCDYDSYCGYLS